MSQISVNSSASNKYQDSNSSKESFSTVADDRLPELIGVDKSEIREATAKSLYAWKEIDGLKSQVYDDIICHLNACRFFKSFKKIEAVVDDFMLVVVKSIVNFIKKRFDYKDLEVLRESGVSVEYLNQKLTLAEKISGRIEIMITTKDNGEDVRFMVFENKSGRFQTTKGLNQCLLSLSAIKKSLKGTRKRNEPLYGVMFNGQYWCVVKFSDKNNICCSLNETFFAEEFINNKLGFLNDEYSKLISIIYSIITNFLGLKD